MTESFLAPLWPILVPYCGMDIRKSHFSLISGTFSFGGCWCQPMLLFWKLVDETQISKPLEATRHHNLTKSLILLPFRAIWFRPFQYDTPCRFVVSEFVTTCDELKPFSPWLFSYWRFFQIQTWAEPHFNSQFT